MNRSRYEASKKFYSADQHTTYKLEADFLAAATDFAKLADILVVRQAQATRRGVADLLLCCNGIFIAAELKAEDGTPSPHQLKFIDKVTENGGLGAVCSTLGEIWELLDEAWRTCST